MNYYRRMSCQQKLGLFHMKRELMLIQRLGIYLFLVRIKTWRCNYIFLKSVSIFFDTSDHLVLDETSKYNVLVFLCKVGVGYGHVNIEASLCGLPILSLNPGLDVEWFLKDSCNDTTDQIAKRIINKDYKCVTLPLDFKSENIKRTHIELIKKLIWKPKNIF